MHASLGPWFFASLIISAIGFVLFVYGKKMARAPQLVVGLVMLIYPYFVTAPIPMVSVGAVLLVGLCVGLRLGW